MTSVACERNLDVYVLRVLAPLTCWVLLLSSLGPLFDHHFEERGPNHAHVFLAPSVQNYGHGSTVLDHDETDSASTSSGKLPVGSVAVSGYTVNVEGLPGLTAPIVSTPLEPRFLHAPPEVSTTPPTRPPRS